MNLGDVKIIDLKASDVDWDSPLTDPANGKYSFRKKVIWDRQAGSLSGKYFPRFVTDDKEGNIESWQYAYDASPVRYEDMDFYPEPLKPNATHGYQFKDAVLMRINTEMWMNEVAKNRKMSNDLRQNNQAAFNSQMETIDDGHSARLDVNMSDVERTERILEQGKVKIV